MIYSFEDDLNDLDGGIDWNEPRQFKGNPLDTSIIWEPQKTTNFRRPTSTFPYDNFHYRHNSQQSPQPLVKNDHHSATTVWKSKKPVVGDMDRSKPKPVAEQQPSVRLITSPDQNAKKQKWKSQQKWHPERNRQQMIDTVVPAEQQQSSPSSWSYDCRFQAYHHVTGIQLMCSFISPPFAYYRNEYIPNFL